jgi:hypothetical protein
VEQANRAPEVFVRAGAAGEVAHAGGNGFAMLAQAFGLDPIVQKSLSALGQ